MRIFIISILSAMIIPIGIISSKRLKKSEKTLYELSKLLKFMARSIKDTRRELNEIFISFDSPFFDKIGFSQRLGEKGFDHAVRKLDIPKDCKDILYEFSLSLGKTFASDQIASCLDTARLLDEKVSTMHNEYPEKRRLYIGMSVFIAFALFIICI